MTTEEFNKKYDKYLEEGHYGLDLYKQEAIDYLDKEFEELVKIPGFKYSQIKSKFTWFCFYCDNVPVEKITEIETNLKLLYTK